MPPGLDRGVLPQELELLRSVEALHALQRVRRAPVLDHVLYPVAALPPPGRVPRPLQGPLRQPVEPALVLPELDQLPLGPAPVPVPVQQGPVVPQNLAQPLLVQVQLLRRVLALLISD